MTTAEACYLFDAAVYREMTFDLSTPMESVTTPEQFKPVFEQYKAHIQDCDRDMTLAAKHLPADHPINTYCEGCISTYWFKHGDQLKAKFN